MFSQMLLFQELTAKLNALDYQKTAFGGSKKKVLPSKELLKGLLVGVIKNAGLALLHKMFLGC